MRISPLSLRPLGLLAGALAVVALAPGALVPALAEDPKDAEDRPLEERKRELDERFAALEKDAAALAESYRALHAERVAELARANNTLKRLYEAGVFTTEGLIGGLPSDPLAALPWLRRALEDVDNQARRYAIEYGSMAREANERVALSTLRKLIKSQETFREEDRDGNGVRDYAADIQKLSRSRLFERNAQNGFTANGYKFTILHGDILTYSATAVPEVPGDTGELFYFLDQTGVIRAERNKTATAKSPPVPGQQP